MPIKGTIHTSFFSLKYPKNVVCAYIIPNVSKDVQIQRNKSFVVTQAVSCHHANDVI